jgi:hypothetical protein
MYMQHNFDPTSIDYLISKDKLTNFSGLKNLMEAFNEGKLKAPFTEALPERVGPNSEGSYRLGLIQVASFLFGHDCLADLEKFKRDPFVTVLFGGEVVSPRTMGDFLRDFETENLIKMNDFLRLQSRSYRKQLFNMLKKEYKPKLAPHLFIDSTSHVQSGKKIEGVAYNYKDEWCLDSQMVFDELGFCWDMELRSGNTKSGVGAVEQIKRVFSDYKFNDKKYLSADSAYCNQEIIKALISLGVQFTITANNGTTGWENHIDEITNWVPWVWTSSEKDRAYNYEMELPEIEVGSFHWRPSWNEGLVLPVVVKREKAQQTDLFNGGYKYYGVVTNHSLFLETAEQVLRHHNKRGNSENFIREGKYGYDLKHFPCLKMNANHAYGLLAFVSHNMLRWVSWHDNPHKPHYAKYIREKFLIVPGKIVSHSRMLVLRVPEYFYKEVQRIREALELKPNLHMATGGP